MIKKVLIPALALAAASVAVPAAAQSYRGDNNWQSINQRQHTLDRRIDQGIRSGQLNRREASNIRAQFNGLVRLENQYRRGGLTRWERTDLDRRFDSLSAQIRYERRDRQRARW